MNIYIYTENKLFIIIILFMLPINTRLKILSKIRIRILKVVFDTHCQFSMIFIYSFVA